MLGFKLNHVSKRGPRCVPITRSSIRVIPPALETLAILPHGRCMWWGQFTPNCRGVHVSNTKTMSTGWPFCWAPSSTMYSSASLCIENYKHADLALKYLLQFWCRISLCSYVIYGPIHSSVATMRFSYVFLFAMKFVTRRDLCNKDQARMPSIWSN